MIFSIILIISFLNIFLGAIVYKKDPKSASHKLLVILSIIFALWSIANYYSLNSNTPEQTLFWIRMVMFITSPLGPVIYLFIKAYPKAKLDVNKLFLVLLILATLGICIGCTTKGHGLQ